MSKINRDHEIAARAIALAGVHFETRDAGDAFEVISQKLTTHTDTVMEKIREVKSTGDGLASRMLDIEQTLAEGFRGGAPRRRETWGSQFVKERGDDLRALAGTSRGALELNVKGTLFNIEENGAALDDADRDPTVAMRPRRRMTIRQLLPTVEISSGSVEFAKQTARTMAAAVVAEGDLKPESGMTFDLEVSKAQVIAHWTKASRQILDDVPQLRDVIDGEMVYGLMLAEEAQILSGNGTGSNLSGLMTNATAFSPAAGLPNAQRIDRLGLAILQVALADFDPTGIVMHPADWWAVRLMKDSEGRYIFGDPQSDMTPRLFGLPVVATQAMSAGNFLVGDFASAATLYDRLAPRVEVGYVDDDFKRNLVTVLCEERIALAVKQATALVTGNFTFA